MTRSQSWQWLDNATCRYTCVKETATYDTPRGLNVMREDEKEPWSMCSPQVYSKYRLNWI